MAMVSFKLRTVLARTPGLVGTLTKLQASIESAFPPGSLQSLYLEEHANEIIADEIVTRATHRAGFDVLELLEQLAAARAQIKELEGIIADHSLTAAQDDDHPY